MILKLYSALALKFISLDYEGSIAEAPTPGCSEYSADKKYGKGSIAAASR
jgi:hypothetical protein